MFDDDAARRALRELSDEPMPPVATTFDEVVRRGRRRVLVQRVAGAAGVMVVVAAIGVGAMLLRPSDQSGGVEVGGTNSVTTTTTTSPSTPSAPSIRNEEAPTETSKPLVRSGWVQTNMPAGIDPDADGCMKKDDMKNAVPDVTVPPENVVRSALEIAIKEGLSLPPMSTNTPDWGGTSGHMVVEVPVNSSGNGQIQLEAKRFGGTPRQAADGSVMAEGNCEAPYRTTLKDGTVLQLYPTRDEETAHPVQSLRIYRPNGLMYTIVSAGYSETDMTPALGTSGSVVEGGRGALPTTAEQLAVLGERLAQKLS